MKRQADFDAGNRLAAELVLSDRSHHCRGLELWAERVLARLEATILPLPEIPDLADPPELPDIEREFEKMFATERTENDRNK